MSTSTVLSKLFYLESNPP